MVSAPKLFGPRQHPLAGCRQRPPATCGKGVKQKIAHHKDTQPQNAVPAETAQQPTHPRRRRKVVQHNRAQHFGPKPYKVVLLFIAATGTGVQAA